MSVEVAKEGVKEVPKEAVKQPKCVDCKCLMSERIEEKTIVKICWKCQKIREIESMMIVISIKNKHDEVITQTLPLGAVFEVQARED
jgi:predicted glycosyltransferase